MEVHCEDPANIFCGMSCAAEFLLSRQPQPISAWRNGAEAKNRDTNAPQIEAVKLAAESQRKHLEATLANAKRDAAQAATSQKTAAAVWHGELDFQKAEVRPTPAQHPVSSLCGRMQQYSCS